MDWKLVSAFATGAVLASGIVYFSVRPDIPRAEGPKQDVPKQEAAKLPAPEQVPAPLPTPQVAAAPKVAAPVHSHIPVREKPSPMPPPVRRQKEIVIARSVPPPVPAPVESAPPTPAPAPAPVAAPAPAPAPTDNLPVQNVSMPAPATRVPNVVTLAAGTLLPVRIGETLSSARNQTGDSFLATLSEPLVIDGWIIADRGARLEGRVVDASQAGRVRGVSYLRISLVRLATADHQNIRISTEPYVRTGSSSTGTDAAKIGGGAALGAIIGAIAGGGKGAAIGAGAGGAAGAGDVLLTRGKTAEIPVETRVSFKVQDSVVITEKLD